MFCLFLFGSLFCVVFASSSNWVEVARFTGNESTQTELFTCDFPEWRIRVEVVPNVITHYFFAHLLTFSVTLHPQGEEVSYVRLITMENGNWTDTMNGEWTDFNGTSVWSNYEDSYIQDNVGNFYLNIKAEVVDRYLIIVEQNIDSIPEFPSWTLLPLFLISTLIGIMIKKRLSLQN